MSINTLQLVEGLVPFLLEQGEILRYSSPTKRQTFAVAAKSGKLSVKAKDGTVYVTNKRFVFSTASQGDIDTFHINWSDAPQLQFSHAIKSPWFGANYWEFLFYSPSTRLCDGLPSNEYFQGQIYFMDGGLYDFVAHCNEAINDAVNNSHIDSELPQYTP